MEAVLMENELKKISKYLSFILRHKPEEINLQLDSNGWASIDELIVKTTSFTLTKALINIVVETNDKQRFSVDLVKGRIRANQGHSIAINLELDSITPPEFLLHGTVECFEASIFKTGLNKQKRHHVHLSENEAVAKAVGGRYGKPVILKVRSREMSELGFKFYKTANQVWLVSEVPPEFIM